jgi:NADP-dependent aldehyde dehydrogenase
MGQFCTKPGLLLAPAGAKLPARVRSALQVAAPDGWMLTAGIADAYSAGVAELLAAGAIVIGTTPAAPTGWSAAPTVLAAPAHLLRSGSRLLAECFGPVAIVAEYYDDAELQEVLDALPGSLAAAVHATAVGDAQLAPLVDALSRTSGRVAVNGWPTGVAVTWAQQHGGPWPATTDPTASSVGAAALRRFVRPVAYQDVPEAVLPPPLHTDNPWHLPRRVDGRIEA